MSELLSELPKFQHMEAERVEEAISWLRKYGNKARAIAGGTDLLSLMKDRIEGPELNIPEVLVNIKNISEMNRITYDEEVGLQIGAAVTLNRLQLSDVIREKFSVLSQAARQVGTTQIRNMGTIGGNLCQRPRCMYFRHPDFLCYKKGGTICYAVKGEHKYYHSIIKHEICAMAHPSDIAPALVALKAKAIITGSDGRNEMPIQDFFLGISNFSETVLKSDELLTEVQIPNQDGKIFQLFLKQRIRHSSDFALCSVATVAKTSGEICEDITIVLGGIASFPYIPLKSEEIVKGKRLNEGLISMAAEASVEGAHPLPMNRYKIDLTKVLVNRVLTSIWHETGHA